MKATIACTFLFSLGTAVFANETAQENTPIHQLPELVVTASLWETDLLHTTHSTTAIDSSVLESSGSLHFQDLIEAIPNLTWTGGTSRPRYFQIRGIGENSQFEGETPDSTVRFLIDDLDFTGLGSIGNLFDMQQVEVLRGPQAGAFGVNAAGGLIKLVSNEPTPYWSGQVEGTIGQDNLRGGGIAFGGPILNNDPEAFTFRLSTYQLSSDGFRSNKTLNRDDTNERDEFNSRLKLKWKASSDWTWDSTLFYANADNGYDEWSLDNTDFTVYSDQPGRDEQESKALSLRGTFDGLQIGKLTTITTYTGTDSLYSYDGDWTSGAYSSYAVLNRKRKRWSEEIRLDTVDHKDALELIDRWTIGLYIEDFKEDSEFGSDWGNFHTRYMSESASLYGQATHLINEKSRITIGLRAEYFNIDSDILNRDDVQFGEWLFGGKLTYEQDLNDNQTFFASLGRGYKAGGINIFPNLNTSLPIQYESETLWNYELGLRSKSWDGKLVSKLTLFYLDRDNAQLRDSKGEKTKYMYFTTNGKGAQHLGLESEASWFFHPDWSLNGSLGILNADRDSYTDPSNGALSLPERALANAPAYTYRLRLAYDPNEGFFINGEVSGSDSYYESNSHDEKRSTFNIVNAALGYRIDNWTLTFWGRNLLNTEYEKSIFYFDNTYDWNSARYENPADPQQFGATLNYTW
jgi:outer membrane receptor protein involved in Fe transport